MILQARTDNPPPGRHVGGRWPVRFLKGMIKPVSSRPVLFADTPLRSAPRAAVVGASCAGTISGFLGFAYLDLPWTLTHAEEPEDARSALPNRDGTLDLRHREKPADDQVREIDRTHHQDTLECCLRG